MDHWDPKHVEPPSAMNKLNHKTFCILSDYIYITRWYTVHTISNIIVVVIIIIITVITFRQIVNKMDENKLKNNNRLTVNDGFINIIFLVAFLQSI